MRRQRILLGLTAFVASLALLWLAFGRGRKEGGSLDRPAPEGVASTLGQSREQSGTAEPASAGRRAAELASADGPARTVAEDGAATASAARAAAGSDLRHLKSAARAYAARALELRKPERPEGTLLAEQRERGAEHESILGAKYQDWSAARIATEIATLQGILDWQTTGPFDADDERLEKWILEELLVEIEWLRSEAGT